MGGQEISSWFEGRKLSRPRYSRVVALVGVLLLTTVLYRACGPSSSPQEAGADFATTRKGAATSRVVPVITTKARLEDFSLRRRTIGIIESPAIVLVKSRIDSQVLEQHVRDGQVVKKGDLLFTLDDREIQALIARDEAQLAKDNAALAQAEADLGRKEELIEKNVAPRQQLDQATAVFKAAQQTVEADQAVLQADRLKLGYAKLEAPIAGRVGAIRVTPGNLVSVNDATGLVTITQVHPIRVGFTLAERDLTALRRASEASSPAVVRVYTPGSSTPLEAGALDFVDSSVDPTSGTISATGKFVNASLELWSGMYVDVEIDLDVRPNTVMIPAVAIQSGQKGAFVFVVKDDQTVEMRNVELVGVEGDRAAVKSGVADGERVIVEGQMRLTSGARVAETSADGSSPVGDKAKDSQSGAEGKAAR
jgi:multidrug efflux system membrane fusion protein